jgi:hypothetical protein
MVMIPQLDVRLSQDRVWTIRSDMERIRLEDQTGDQTKAAAGWMSKAMQRVGGWMIRRGERLVERYSIKPRVYPSSTCDYAR